MHEVAELPLLLPAPPPYSPLPPGIILSLVKQSLYGNETKVAQVARTFSLASVAFLQPWFSIPAILLASKRNKSRRYYERSISLSLAAFAIALCFMMTIISFLGMALLMSKQCHLSDLPQVENANVSAAGKRVSLARRRGSIVCGEGFSLIGETFITCQETGKWSAPSATCFKNTELPQTLQRAAGNGDVTEVKQLLGLDYWLEAKSEAAKVFGAALHRAIESNETTAIDIIKLLVETDAKPDVDFEDGPEQLTPLMVASRLGKTDIVKLLIKMKAEIDKSSIDGETSLMAAANNGHLDVVVALLNPNRQYMNGKRSGARASRRDDNGNTALMFASMNGHLEIVNLLGQHSNVSWRNAAGDNALMMAIENGHLNVVKALLAYKSPTRNPYDERVEFISYINSRNNQGYTALMDAAGYRRYEVVELLLDRGADINITNNGGWTALMFAIDNRYFQDGGAWRRRVRNQDFKIVQLLSDRGADANSIQNERGQTALTQAAEYCDVPSFTLLLNKTANINFQVANGMTALSYAAWSGCTEIIKPLLERGADVLSRDNEGRTAMTWAVLNKNHDVAKLLMEKEQAAS